MQSGAFKLGKEGCVFLQFAPAGSTRQYEWDKKQVILASVCVLCVHDHEIISQVTICSVSLVLYRPQEYNITTVKLMYNIYIFSKVHRMS